MSAAHPDAKPGLSVAEVLRVFLPDYLKTHALPAHQVKVLRHLELCRAGNPSIWIFTPSPFMARMRSCKNTMFPGVAGARRESWPLSCRTPTATSSVTETLVSSGKLQFNWAWQLNEVEHMATVVDSDAETLPAVQSKVSEAT
jgi:hypothetical protein